MIGTYATNPILKKKKKKCSADARRSRPGKTLDALSQDPGVCRRLILVSVSAEVSVTLVDEGGTRSDYR